MEVDVELIPFQSIQVADRSVLEGEDADWDVVVGDAIFHSLQVTNGGEEIAVFALRYVCCKRMKLVLTLHCNSDPDGKGYVTTMLSSEDGITWAEEELSLNPVAVTWIASSDTVRHHFLSCMTVPDFAAQFIAFFRSANGTGGVFGLSSDGVDWREVSQVNSDCPSIAASSLSVRRRHKRRSGVHVN